MHRARAVVAVLVAALAVAATGCGKSEEDKAKSAVEDYLEAVSNGDGDKACGLVTAATKKKIEQSAKRPCPQTFSSLNQGPGKAVLEAFKDAKVEGVKVDGDKATADIKLRQLSQKTNLRKEDGDWKLESTGIAG
jgi:hypothetical protein